MLNNPFSRSSLLSFIAFQESLMLIYVSASVISSSFNYCVLGLNTSLFPLLQVTCFCYYQSLKTGQQSFSNQFCVYYFPFINRCFLPQLQSRTEIVNKPVYVQVDDELFFISVLADYVWES